MKQTYVEADVLCVGGGIAGLMAAINASKFGAKVVVAEKANTLRSGAAATGNDHFLCYIPEIHGADLAGLIGAMRETQLRGIIDSMDRDIIERWLLKSRDIIDLWDSWGVPMKYDGKYEFAGHAFPGSPFFYLKFEGRDVKRVLTRETLEKGVTVLNRVMVFDLLQSNGWVVGALAVSTREDELFIFKARSVILGTGTVTRLYPGLTPGWMFNITRPGSVTGDGRAMAYRIGAELLNMEMPGSHAGPKYFTRSGQATWVGVVRDPQGSPVGPFLTTPHRKYNDMIIEVNKGVFHEYSSSGRGPLYMDCRGITDEDHKYMMHWMVHEGNSALIPYFEEEGIDLRQNPVEFSTYGMRSSGGRIWQNVKGETSVTGLFAAGDETTGVGIAEAAISGWIAGESAAVHARECDLLQISKEEIKTDKWRSLLAEIRRRQGGPDWKEVNIALQQIMQDYTGTVRSETLLQAGLAHLGRLKKKAYETMMAKNQHDLVRCLEVLNLLELGELIFEAAMERKETRGLHVRPDYPYANPLLDKLLVVKKVDGKPAMEWRRVKR